jgi:hypothetical protein
MFLQYNMRGKSPPNTSSPGGLRGSRSRANQQYTLAQRQIIVYVEKVDPAGTPRLTYAARAKYPAQARSQFARGSRTHRRRLVRSSMGLSSLRYSLFDERR